MAIVDKQLAVTTGGLGQLINDSRVRSVLYQIIVFGAVFGVGWYLYSNTLANMAARGMRTGFDFLWASAGFGIGWHYIEYQPGDTYWRIYWVGITNTLLLSIFSIVSATILGFIMGVVRLSRNFMVALLARSYVEALRNVPLLLQILYWYLVIFGLMPAPRQSLSFLDIAFLNNRGIYLPKALPEPLFWITGAAIAAGIVAAVLYRHWAKQKQDATGERSPVLLVSLGLVIGLPLVVFLVTGLPVTWSIPELKGFNFVGGWDLPPSFLAVYVALTIYSSAYIAEMVRAGILSVSHGQTEAAFSLGLRPSWTMRLIVIPQAMRAIVPPLISGWLNITKNSSLAVAVGFPDIVSVYMHTALNQSGRAIEIIGLVMLFYMTCSLTVSIALNIYNKRVQLKER